jgi:hypothetical protein
VVSALQREARQSEKEREIKRERERDSSIEIGARGSVRKWWEEKWRGVRRAEVN